MILDRPMLQVTERGLWPKNSEELSPQSVNCLETEFCQQLCEI